MLSKLVWLEAKLTTGESECWNERLFHSTCLVPAVNARTLDRMDAFSSIVLSLIAIILYTLTKRRSSTSASYSHLPPPPSPGIAWPIVGHLPTLRKYKKNPWTGFWKLHANHGDLVKLQLGTRKVLLVSSIKLIRTVLLTKGDVFVDRPDFSRYHVIFDGDRENALALCDWSRTQRLRRVVATISVLPRFGSQMWSRLEHSVDSEMSEYLEYRQPGELNKTQILVLSAAVFTRYLCSKKFSHDDPEFTKAVIGYDYIFEDINLSHPWDFLPWLPLFGVGRQYFNRLSNVCKDVRRIMETTVINPRLQGLEKRSDGSYVGTPKEEYIDFLDVSLDHHFKSPDIYPWHVAVFEVLDLIGGHSAVGNLLMRLLGFLSLNPEAQRVIHYEATCVAKNGQVYLDDRTNMPYTEAALFETLRLASSPIIPHCAARDTDLDGYFIEKGTMVLFNNYRINMGEEYWSEPTKFRPMRFLVRGKHPEPSNEPAIDEEGVLVLNNNNNNGNSNAASSYPNVSTNNSDSTNNNEVKNALRKESGELQYEEGIEYRVSKPDYFLPFSVGRRACLGYKMVHATAFAAVANLMLKFTIEPVDEEMVIKQLKPNGDLSLPLEDGCFKLILKSRCDN